MRFPVGSRVFAFALACWFGLLIADMHVVHPCPMHDGPMHAGSPMPSHHGHGGHAMHCTCLGACTGASATALPPTPPARSALVAIRTVLSEPLPPERRISTPVPHLLPLSHAPPLSL